MKRQYLGDEKDAFKWDYHDFLVRKLGHKKLGYGELVVVLMMNEGDTTRHGETCPEKFEYPENTEIIEFCLKLKAEARAIKKRLQEILAENRQDINLLKKFPKEIGRDYKFTLYGDKESDFDNGRNRDEYFRKFLDGKFLEKRCKKFVVFIDPDNGFETIAQYEKRVRRKNNSRQEKYLRFCEVTTILDGLPKEAVISVYQTHRYGEKPGSVFSGIKSTLKKLSNEYNFSALVWRGKVTFIQISKSKKAIGRVQEFNAEYIKTRKKVTLLS